MDTTFLRIPARTTVNIQIRRTNYTHADSRSAPAWNSFTNSLNFLLVFSWAKTLVFNLRFPDVYSSYQVKRNIQACD